MSNHPEDSQFSKQREAAEHSREAFTLLDAERHAREVRKKLDLVNFFTKGGFEDEIERVEKLIKRLGARRRTIMKKPSTRETM